MIQILLDRGSDKLTNIRTESNSTALMRAASRGHDKAVSILLQERADANAIDQYGRTALILAAYNGFDKVIKNILIHVSSIDADIQDHMGWTALIAAAHNGNSDIVEMLLLHGADVYLSDQDGMRAFDYMPKIRVMYHCLHWPLRMSFLMFLHGCAPLRSELDCTGSNNHTHNIISINPLVNVNTHITSTTSSNNCTASYRLQALAIGNYLSNEYFAREILTFLYFELI